MVFHKSTRFSGLSAASKGFIPSLSRASFFFPALVTPLILALPTRTPINVPNVIPMTALGNSSHQKWQHLLCGGAASQHCPWILQPPSPASLPLILQEKLQHSMQVPAAAARLQLGRSLSSHGASQDRGLKFWMLGLTLLCWGCSPWGAPDGKAQPQKAPG